jgi:hypothetical protein
MIQGNGGDNFAVRWQLPNGTIEEPIPACSSNGTRMIPFTGANTVPGIFTQPVDCVALEGSDAQFSVLVTNRAPVAYQWWMNGASVPTGTQACVQLPYLEMALSNATFVCVVSNASGVVTSSPARLIVQKDTNLPVIVRAFNAGVTNAQVIFSKQVEADSATFAGNYVFTNGLAVTSATLGSDRMTVTLSTGAVVYGSNYTLVVNNVRDTVPSHNLIPANSTFSFTASPFVSCDIGTPPLETSYCSASNGWNVSASGSGIDGQADQFYFGFQIQSSNFDVQVRVAGLTPSDAWAKAGLMARETLKANSRFAAALATPSMNGSLFEWRSPEGAVPSTLGQFPVNYPMTWLRLKRSGNEFAGFASYDGVIWNPLGSATISMPNTLYLGYALSSRNEAQAAFAQFRDFGTTETNASIGTVAAPHEPLGPCDRKTALVISEIMYKPASRADSSNLEFLEIYNSNPYYQEIGGYTLAGTKMNYTFPAGTVLPGGGFLVVAASPGSICSVYGMSNVCGPYSGSLTASDTIKLLDDQGTILLNISYSSSSPWPVAAKGTGHSIVLANPTYGANNPKAWAISDSSGGSPGTDDPYCPSPLRDVVINELSAGTATFIELFNHGSTTNDLSGCILTDAALNNKFVIPAGTLIQPGGYVSFDQAQLGFSLSRAGGTVFFIKPDRSHILDAAQFEAQDEGISFGRWPNGANDWYFLSSSTPGASNSSIIIGDIAINEIMYKPISGNDDNQYIELYNQGTAAVDLSNWKFTSGISFTFPSNTWLAANGYLVVARNLTNLLASYPYLTASNAVGNFSEKLAHKGERVVLAQPQTLIEIGSSKTTTNTIYVVRDEVTYGVGGRWGRWSKGGGSSLELTNPNSNHRLVCNWADSDESSKSSWTNLEVTAVLDNGANYNSNAIDYVQLGLLDVGECLISDVEIRPDGLSGANIVANGDFSEGQGSWSAEGDHMRSSVEANPAGGYYLHLRASDTVWTLANYVKGPLTSTNLSPGQTATLRMKVRWLCGSPEVLARVRGNWVELTGAAPIPRNLGTPGLPNSTFTTNAGPAIYQVSHSPALPAASQSVVVTARFHDVSNFVASLLYRVDTSVNTNPAYTSVPMLDDGTSGDAISDDGIYSATIPGQSQGTVVAFIIQAVDSQNGRTIFPADIKDNAGLPRECAFGFGDDTPTGIGFSHHHMFITQNWAARWAKWGGISHETHDITWIDGGGRIVYNARGRYAGSPYHQYTGSPVTTTGGMHWTMPADDLVFGTTSLDKQHVPGNGPLDDDTFQREQAAFWMARQIGLRGQNRRYYLFYVNGNRHAPIMEDAQAPNGDVIDEYFPDDNNGWLYKQHAWFEGNIDQNANGIMNFDMESFCLLKNFTTPINGTAQKKLARYRWMWWIRRYPDSANSMTNVYNLVDAFSTPTSSPNYYNAIEDLVDTEEWMRLSAVEHATGDWDSFFTQSQWNMYNYKPVNGKWTAIKWDWNVALGGGSTTWPADGSDLFFFNSYDANMASFQTYPPYFRAYLRGLKDLAELGMNNTMINPMLDAKYSALQAAGINAASPAALKSWISQMHGSILTALTNQGVADVPFAIDSTVTTNGNLLTFTGTAPLDAKTILVNGESFPVAWTSAKKWSITLPVSAGANHFIFQGFDINGNALTNVSSSVDATYNGKSPNPIGSIVINEIMYDDAVPGSEFVELYNTNSVGFDISGWRFQGLSYTFPSGSIIGPKNYLVLAKNRFSFATAYGSTTPLFGTFDGTLQTNGETLTLLQPDASGTNEIVIARVRYETGLPWPSGASGTGCSLQLISPSCDNWRAGNWAVNTNVGFMATPAGANSVAKEIPAFPPLWINELEVFNRNGITNSAGNHVAWIELFNPSTNIVSLSGLYLANSYTNLAAWAFPANTVIKPGQFKIVFADGKTTLSTSNKPHTSFTLSNSAGALALSRLYNNGPQILDYVNYTNMVVDHSYGSLPDGQSFSRQDFLIVTPGASNIEITLPEPSYVSYAQEGALYSQNFDSLPNPGSKSVNSANPVTISGVTYSLSNPFDFAFPVFASGGIGGLGLSNMAGWYGLANASDSTGVRFGASSGSQATGGQISFGLPSNNNRALGLLATGVTGFTAFGVKFVNETTQTLTRINVAFKAELWRKSNLPKTLACSYLIDPSAIASFSTDATGVITNLNISFPTSASATGGVAVDGTANANSANVSVVNQLINDWAPGAALWLVWEMADSTEKAQGLAMDNLVFSATHDLPPIPSPSVAAASMVNGQLVLTWPTISGAYYQLEYKTNLNDASWTPVGGLLPGNGATLSATNSLNEFSQCYLRLKASW